MPVLSAYIAGVSTTGIELINDALNKSFGDGAVELEELGRDNLRYKVRQGSKNTSVVLVILDSVSMEECKSIEGGLYKSDKFYNYSNDKDLVDFLNSKYELSLSVPEDILSIKEEVENFSNLGIPDDALELIDNLRSQLQDKDSIIRTLNMHIKELKNIIDSCGYVTNSEELDSVKDENLALKNRVSDLLQSLEDIKIVINEKDATISDLNTAVSNAKNEVFELTKSIDVKDEELSTERNLSSKKSGIIRDKDKEIERVNKLLEGLQDTIELNNSYKIRISELEDEVKILKSEAAELTIATSKKDSEIERLNSIAETKGKVDKQVQTYKTLLDDSDVKIADLEKKLSDFETQHSDLIVKFDSLVDDYNKVSDKNEELSSKYNEVEQFLAEANTVNIKLKNRVAILEKSTSRDENIETVVTELSELRKDFAILQTNIFTMISSKSLPHSGVKVPIFKGIPDRYDNIRFLFSGSTESRKGTYKCLYNECMSNMNDKYLIVDVTSETAIDYVFQMRNIIDGMNWFSVGGGVQKYISSTCLSNVRVLMPKLGYVNDSFFLTVNWERRLSELNNSGYKVIVYCGDVSNLVGRILFESFSEVGITDIYVHGNVLGSRSIIANATGLIGIKKSTIGYYDFDKSISKFYDIMSRKCKCKIISYIQGV